MNQENCDICKVFILYLKFMRVIKSQAHARAHTLFN